MLCFVSHFFTLSIHSDLYVSIGHGKTAVDGLGGRIKNLARQHCLRGGSIRNAKDLHDFIVSDFPNVFATYVPKEEIEALGLEMKDRFDHAKQIPGTQGFHCFTPIEGNIEKIECRVYSSQEEPTAIKRVTE